MRRRCTCLSRNLLDGSGNRCGLALHSCGKRCALAAHGDRCAFSGGNTYSTTTAIAATEDDLLYQSERYGNFSYNIPVKNGEYEVTLKFAEIYWTTAGQRVFDVLIEGKTVISKLDLVAKVGSKAAYNVTVPVIVADGMLNISFQSVVDFAKISAITVGAK